MVVNPSTGVLKMIKLFLSKVHFNWTDTKLCKKCGKKYDSSVYSTCPHCGG